MPSSSLSGSGTTVSPVAHSRLVSKQAQGPLSAASLLSLRNMKLAEVAYIRREEGAMASEEQTKKQEQARLARAEGPTRRTR